MTPPATAPTFGPELDDFELELIVDGDAADATQIVCWQASQVGGTSEQISLLEHSGQAGVSLGHPVTHRRKRLCGTGSISRHLDGLEDWYEHES